MDVSIFIVLFLALLPVLYLLFAKQKHSKKRLPPGSFGLPVIGQTFSLLRALRANTGEKWLANRVNRYGPVSRLSLFGCPTVFLVGPSANKFIFGSEALTAKQTASFNRIVGWRSLREMIGEEHRHVRGMIVQFLKIEVLRKYVGRMDEEVRLHLRANWSGRQMITVMPLMKSLTFDIICTLIFGIERGPIRQELSKEFLQMVRGIWAVPLNLPFIRFSKYLSASRRARKALTRVIQEKRMKLEQGQSSLHDDLITYMLGLSRDGEGQGLTEEEIIDNVMFLMVAGHDTTAILLTFMIRQLDKDQATYTKVLQEQEEIARAKAPGEALSWDDLSKMKYTWSAAMETLRMVPPVFGTFRKVLEDVEFNGYLIPKGWQVMYATNMTQMDSTIFKEPHKFDPTRFENQSAIPPYCFVAFGGGVRICPGNEFARVETLVAMHYIVTQFKWELASNDDSFSRYPLPSPSQGLPIKLEPKERYEKTS